MLPRMVMDKPSHFFCQFFYDRYEYANQYNEKPFILKGKCAANKKKHSRQNREMKQCESDMDGEYFSHRSDGKGVKAFSSKIQI